MVKPVHTLSLMAAMLMAGSGSAVEELGHAYSEDPFRAPRAPRWPSPPSVPRVVPEDERERIEAAQSKRERKAAKRLEMARRHAAAKGRGT